MADAAARARALERAAVFLLAFQIVLRLCVSSSSGEALNLLAHSLIWVAAAAWLSSRALADRWTARLTGTEIPLAVLLVLSVASVPRASYAFAALDGAAAFASLALLVPLTACVFHGRRAPLLALLVGGLLALGTYGILQRFWILPELVSANAADMTRKVFIRAQSGEVFATFFYPNSFGGFLALLLPVAVGAFLDTKDVPTRAVCAIAAVAGLACLVFTGSMGAWIAAAGGALVFVALRVRRRAVLLGLAIAGVAAVALAGPRLLRHDSLQIRAVYWSAAARIAAAHPVLGVGLNNFGEHYYRARDERQEESDRVHNDYLQLLVELGIPGLLAWLAFLGLTVRGAARPVEPEPEPDRTIQGLLAGGVFAGIAGAAILRGVFLDVGGAVVVLAVVCTWVGGTLVARPTWGAATRDGLLAGLAAAAVHALIDFDLYDYGVAETIFLVAALAVSSRARECGRRPAAVATVALALPAIAALGIMVPRLMTAESLRAEANEARRAGRLDLDLAGLEEAARENPLDAGTHATLAEARQQHWRRTAQAADAQRCREAWLEALRLRPHHSPYASGLAAFVERTGDLREAHTWYVRALELYPTRAANHCAVARTLDRLGRPDEAPHHYRHARRLHGLAGRSPHLRLAPPQLIRALARVGDHDALVALLRGRRDRVDLRRLTAELGDDYDALTREAIDRALDEASR